ncbi:BQ5605_C016g08066 [Microbotryum silenes-dioicae]|uniref:BQ5605_C016g08066 protein n=1 Tax=Microbotryum silenes-dioicae TaxID=796604 RepID=A0A2X0NSU8_9BASI|nr:BQ5605_C016g08066 [Microbotryum silenes-dioicae]
MADSSTPAASGGGGAPGAGAGAVGAPAAGTRRREEARAAGFFDNPIVKSLAQAYMVYIVVNWGLRYLPGTSQHATANGIKPLVPPASGSAASLVPGGGARSNPVKVGDQGTVLSTTTKGAGFGAGGSLETLVAVWEEGSLLDVIARLSTSLDGEASPDGAVLPEVKWDGIPYAPGWETKVFEAEFEVPKSVQHNASLYLDVFVTRADAGVDQEQRLHVRKLLTRYMPLRKVRHAKKLIGSSKPTEEELAIEAIEVEREKNEVKPIVSYYHPNVTLELVTGSGNVAYTKLPDPLKVHVKKVGESKDEAGNGYMYPILWANDFWLMKEHMQPINESTSRLPIRIELKPISHFKWTIFATLEDSMAKSSQSAAPGTGDAFDGNPYMLIATIMCSILHMVFEFLAFTSDVKHWRSKKDLVGASVNTIITNVVVQLIILLYLMDHNEDTSNVILLTQGLGLAVEAWKITKAVDISVVPQTAGGVLPYKLLIKDKHVLSEEEKRTQEYDRLAFRIVGYATVPCLIAYTLYSLYYNEHKGWYSFCITTAVSFVYAFGFVQLVPQLIINYKLKSVAHLPMKSMAYKFFGTIIDDLAAFVVKQPLFHRLAVFRDDVVFLVLLYQMYIYRVDPTRANEYGQKLTEEEAKRLLEEKKKEEVEAAAKGEGVKEVKEVSAEERKKQ